jgi:hypothetical protein
MTSRPDESVSGTELPAKAGAKDIGFRLLLGGFLLLLALGCIAILAGETSSVLERLSAGAVGLACIFIVFAMAMGPTSRLYGWGILFFCLLFGGFGSAICLPDPKCAPNDEGLLMVAEAITLACAVLVFNAFPPGSAARLMSRAAALESAGALFYFAHIYPALAGALMFLGLVIAVPTAVTLKGDPPADGRKPRASTAISILGISGLYAVAYFARDWWGLPLIVTFATAWLVSVLYEAWKSRRQRTEAPT